MSFEISLLNGHVFVFVVVFVVAILFIAFYDMIRPEVSIKYNFDPFPKVTPTDLPDPQHQNDTCWKKLTPCDKDGLCKGCLGDYKCKTVERDGIYNYNGISVPAGQWCLPDDHNPDPQCNTYTGRWLWVFDPEYCENDQCWKCECMYPSLYGSGESGDCTLKLACQNISPDSKSRYTGQQKNKLVGTKWGKFPGKEWDPTCVDDPSCDTNILSYSPYTKDTNGNPWFACNCTSEKDGQFYTTLPNDPMTCHLDPCFASRGYSAADVVCNEEGCSCPACGTNMGISPNGKFAGTCVDVATACEPGGWDPKEGKCTCGGGESSHFEQKCRNPANGVNQDDTSLPVCLNPSNAVGSECINPCADIDCAHGAVRTATSATHCFCDCSTAKRQDVFWCWGGKKCEIKCLADGAEITDMGNDCWSVDCCCSGVAHGHSNSTGPPSWYCGPGSYELHSDGKLCRDMGESGCDIRTSVCDQINK